MADTIMINKALYAQALEEIAAVRRAKYPETLEPNTQAAAAALFAAAWRFAAQYQENYTPRPAPAQSTIPASHSLDPRGAAAESAERVRSTMREIATSAAATTQFDHRAKLVGLFTQFAGLREETAEKIVDNYILIHKK